jgi:hypothetical protein
MLKKIVSGIMLTLFLVSVLTFIHVPTYANLPLNLLVVTNKKEYYMRESMNVYVNLTENDTPCPDGLVGLQINDAKNMPFVMRTLNGSSTKNNWKMEILKLTPCNSHGDPKTDFKKGPYQLAYFNVTVRNNFTEILNVLIFINLHDRYMIPFDYSFSASPVPIGAAEWIILSIPVSEEIPTGDATVYANVYSDWPSQGGVPYCPEKSASFRITDNATYKSTCVIPAVQIPAPGNITHHLAYRLSPNPDAGTYTVYATSQYNMEESSTATTFEVKESSFVPPTPDFFWTPPKPYPNCNITFDASFSTPNGPEDDYITNYWFDFGDETNSTSTGQTGQLQYHGYSEVKTYIVTLNVTDNEGLWAITSKPLTVYSTYGPTANFTYPESYVNVTTTFNASCTLLGWNGTHNPSIVNYTWNFGDGTPDITETDPIATHIYTTVENYTVTLNVTDSVGQQDTISKNITVSIPPEICDIAVLDVTLSDTEVYNGTGTCLGEKVNITVVIRNNGTTMESFNITLYYDNNTILTQNITDMYGLSEETLIFTWDVTYVQAGIYTIKVEAELLENETNTENNTYINGTIKIKIMGDINGDGWVYLSDLDLFGRAWYSREGDTNYNPDCDFDNDGLVYLTDLNVFGENWYKQAW